MCINFIACKHFTSVLGRPLISAARPGVSCDAVPENETLFCLCQILMKLCCWRVVSGGRFEVENMEM